ncbi:universal stress protein [Natronomonas sp. F2-12]|jgi:nucleotide-binding universal stress UspA family protein|uniref:Universal stress protein n=1 Tax=Natronomonas aquatica TaxID=2841590 RepID=A0A9R1CW02_9EURY|nr:universal stress protein [Natronomonas aquatica]MCQ4334788.1 universal stress protein [Natronomonas aquatica]
MALETLVVAVGPNDDTRTKELTEAILDIAEPTGASVVLLHVFTERAYNEGLEEAGFTDEDPPSATELAGRLEGIDILAAELEAAGVPYEIRGSIGTEGETIIQETEAVGGDLLYLSGRKRSPTGKAVFGSTSHRIMMNAGCPVLFVREGVYATDENRG